MVFKPNYNQQRAERNRLKQAKKDAKLREREEVATRRKEQPEDAAPGSPNSPVDSPLSSEPPVSAEEMQRNS